MKKTLTAICAAVLLLGCLLTLPTPTEAAKATTSTSQKVQITKQPASASVFTGSKIKVKVTAKGTGLKYKWYYKDKKSKSYKLDKSITGSTYNRKMTKSMDGRKIYCKITDKYGNTVKTKTVTLTAMVKAKITTQPKSVKVYAGSKGTVKVKATGDQLIYKWYYKDKGSKSYKLDKTVSGSTYNREMTKAMNGRKVYCKITDAYGNTVKTKTVTITVRNKATITKQPVSTAVYSGENASVKIKATGDGITYTWYYKDKGMSSFKKVTSMKSTTYKTKMSASNDGRQVYCLVKDKYGNKVKSNVVTLSTMVTAAITKQPANAGVYLGAAVPVSVTAVGDGISYQWFYKDKGVSTFYADSAYKTSTYNRPMTAAMDGRQVYCRITDQYGNVVKSSTVTLTLKNKATVTAQPGNDSVYAGDAATVSVKATGDGITYKWYYKDKTGKSFQQDKSITGSAYNRTMTAAMNGRQVYCKVTDKYGNTATSATATITVKNKAAITTHPSNASAYAGSDFSVSVAASGDGITYKWYYRTSSSSPWQQDSITTATYKRTMAEGMTGWQVRCRVTDKYGNYVDSNPATLTAKVKAAITTQPASATVREGASAKFTVSAKGDGITCQWEYNDGSAWKSGATGNTYSFAATAAMDGRQIRCKVTDKYGNTATSDVVTLDVQITAAITKQPQNIDTTLEQTVTVSFEVKGDGLTYQWFIKGAEDRKYTELTDVTGNEYSFEVTIENAGSQVYCVVTDSYGNKAATTPITVTAPIPATILKQPVSVHGALGQEATFTIKAAGDGATCVWEQKAPGWTNFRTTSQTGSVFHIPSLTEDYDGLQVRCKVTDKYGNSVYSDEVAISTKPYYINSYGKEQNEEVSCVELLGKEFATTDRVEWTWEKVGNNSDGSEYGFAEEVVTQKQASIRGWYFGDHTYLTKYINITPDDVDTLIGYMKLEGYVLNSESTLNGEVTAYTLIGPETKSTVTYVSNTKELYVTASNTMVYSPLLQENNFSTQSVKIDGAETKLYMLPTVHGGDCYVIQLKNGNFIVFDGDSSATLPNTLEFLKANTPEGQIPVVEAWFITHGHYDHCAWVGGVNGEFANKVRVEGVYYNQTDEYIWEHTVYSWRSDTATTGWRDKAYNPWPGNVDDAVAKMKTSSGETTKMYRPQAGQIYYFCGLQIEIPYCQEQINFCDYQMDLNASSTWYLVRSEEGRTFLDAGDTENVNMDYVIEMYSPDYDIYAGNLDVMSIFHHGHNLYAKYRNTFYAPTLFLPSAGTRSWNAEATTVYSYLTTKSGTYYSNKLRSDKEKRWSSSSRLKDGLGLSVYHYGDNTVNVYNFATGAVTQYS